MDNQEPKILPLPFGVIFALWCIAIAFVLFVIYTAMTTDSPVFVECNVNTAC